MSRAELKAELQALSEELVRRAQTLRRLQERRLRQAAMVGGSTMGALVVLVLVLDLLALRSLDLAPRRLAASPVAPSPAQGAPEGEDDSPPPANASALPPPGPDGSASAPFVAETVPFWGMGDTRQGEDTLSSYACAREFDESGPEIWFQLQLERSGKLAVVVPEAQASGVDVDVHLLQGAQTGEACVARGDFMLTAQVTPGTWYVVVDTFKTPSGTLRPGPFALSVLWATEPEREAPAPEPEPAPEPVPEAPAPAPEPAPEPEAPEPAPAP